MNKDNLAEISKLILERVHPLKSEFDLRDARESYCSDGIGAVLAIALRRGRITSEEAHFLWDWTCRQAGAEEHILEALGITSTKEY